MTEDLTDEAYALGWYTHRYRGERVLHHTGSIRGFRSLIALLPERQQGLIALVNSNDVYLPRALFQAALDTLQDSDPLRWIPSFYSLERAWHDTNAAKYRRDTDPKCPTIAAELIGTCRDDGRFGLVDIAPCAGDLQFRAGRLAYRIVPVGDDLFRCEEPCGPLVIDQGDLRIERHDGHRVAGFEYQGALFKRTA